MTTYNVPDILHTLSQILGTLQNRHMARFYRLRKLRLKVTASDGQSWHLKKILSSLKVHVLSENNTNNSYNHIY